MKDLLELFKCFFRIGATTFGGGYAMLPLIKRDVVIVKKWASEEEILDCFALGQMTPGVIAVNTSTFVGYKVAGVRGAVAATLGMVVPSFCIILVIAAFLKYFASFEIVQHAFGGIRVAVGALILDATLKLLKGIRKNRISLWICGICFVLSAIFKTSPVLLVLAAGLAGFLLFDPAAHRFFPGKGGRK